MREGSPLIYSFVMLMRLLKLTTKHEQAYRLRIDIKDSMMKQLIKKKVAV